MALIPAAALLLLQACSDTETTSSTCDYTGGLVVCVGQGSSFCVNTAQAADLNLASFGEFSTVQGGSSLSATGKQFPGGTDAGAFVTPPKGMTDTDITLNVFLKGALVGTATGPALNIRPTGPDTPATNYISLATTTPFDEVQIVVNASNQDYLVYEFCGGATVR